jgi:hypothetical protein
MSLAARMLRPRDNLQVRDVAARLPAAFVVELSPLRNRADENRPYESMGFIGDVIDHDYGVTIGPLRAPTPASVGP